MTRVGRLLSTLAIVGVAIALMTSAASAESTGSAPAAQPPSSQATFGLPGAQADYCSLNAVRPAKFGANIISGFGFQDCYGNYGAQRITVWLQRSRWWGWEDVSMCIDGFTTASRAACVVPNYICTGQYEYRTLAKGEARWGANIAYRTSPVITIGC